MTPVFGDAGSACSTRFLAGAVLSPAADVARKAAPVLLRFKVTQGEMECRRQEFAGLPDQGGGIAPASHTAAVDDDLDHLERAISCAQPRRFRYGCTFAIGSDDSGGRLLRIRLQSGGIMVSSRRRTRTHYESRKFEYRLLLENVLRLERGRARDHAQV